MRCLLCGRETHPARAICLSCEEIDEAWEVRVTNIAAVVVGLFLFGLAAMAWGIGAWP
jgi:hypothetical protein